MNETAGETVNVYTRNGVIRLTPIAGFQGGPKPIKCAAVQTNS
jgi:hypothetical protein